MQYNPKMERGGDVIKRYTICQIAGNHNSSFLGILDSFVFGDDCFLSMRGIDVMKTWSNYFQSPSSYEMDAICYSMPRRVGHASLGNLVVLHHKANGNTIVITHCEQENEIT